MRKGDRSRVIPSNVFKANSMQKHSFKLLALLIIVVNVIVLSKVAYNRSGTPTQVTLTERELKISGDFNRENSGVKLRIAYRVPTAKVHRFVGGNRIPDWLTEDKMLSLGFSEESMNPTAEMENRTPMGKEVYVALEYNGRAYQKMLDTVAHWHADEIEKEAVTEQDKANADERLRTEKVETSRLFAIDAALEIDSLKAKYGNVPNVFFAKARIRPVKYRNYQEQELGPGTISSLSISHINLPKPYNKIPEKLPPEDYSKVEPPRYEVDLAIGQSLEPWITAMREL